MCPEYGDDADERSDRKDEDWAFCCWQVSSKPCIGNKAQNSKSKYEKIGFVRIRAVVCVHKFREALCNSSGNKEATRRST